MLAVFSADRRQHDLIDQPSQDLRSFVSMMRLTEHLTQPVNVLSIVICKSRMQADGWQVLSAQTFLKDLLPVFESLHPVLQAGTRHTVQQRIDQLVKVTVDFGQLCLSRGARRTTLGREPSDVRGVLPAEKLGQIRGHQVMLKSIEDDVFQRCAHHRRLVGARTLVAGGRTADTGFIEVDDTPTASSARHEAGQ
ncbi:MAG: hypothetical protein AAF674_21005 [Pseudomonadota bacterium]